MIWTLHDWLNNSCCFSVQIYGPCCRCNAGCVLNDVASLSQGRLVMLHKLLIRHFIYCAFLTRRSALALKVWYCFDKNMMHQSSGVEVSYYPPVLIECLCYLYLSSVLPWTLGISYLYKRWTLDWIVNFSMKF